MNPTTTPILTRTGRFPLYVVAILALAVGLMLGLAGMAIMGCATVNRDTLDAIGRASQVAGPALVAAEEMDPRPQSVADATWDPVFVAYRALQVAQDKCATAIEAGGECDGAAVLAAYCSLVGVVPRDVAAEILVMEAACK